MNPPETMNIAIIKYNRNYKIVVADNNLKEDITYKLYPITFYIDQKTLDIFIQNILLYEDNCIKESELDKAEDSLSSFIHFQNSFFALNSNKVLYDKIDKILSFVKSSKNILVPNPRIQANNDIKARFLNFLEENIQITNNRSNVLTSTEIKSPFFSKENIKKDWESFTFKEINTDLNAVLKTWADNNTIETKTIKKIRMPVKYYYGVSLSPHLSSLNDS
ncbi:hypothetical protein Yalta_160 [Yalta virus]|nr:hypothetical protein Yalta_160 [Yalta virus]